MFLNFRVKTGFCGILQLSVKVGRQGCHHVRILFFFLTQFHQNFFFIHNKPNHVAFAFNFFFFACLLPFHAVVHFLSLNCIFSALFPFSYIRSFHFFYWAFMSIKNSLYFYLKWSKLFFFSQVFYSVIFFICIFNTLKIFKLSIRPFGNFSFGRNRLNFQGDSIPFVITSSKGI